MSAPNNEPQGFRPARSVTRTYTPAPRFVMESLYGGYPTKRSPGRPRHADTGSRRIVKEMNATFARVLKVPLKTIREHKRALNSRWGWPMRHLDSAVIDQVMRQLAESLPRVTPLAPEYAERALSYAAGFVDGEAWMGTAAYRRDDRVHEGYRLALRIANKDLQALQFVQRALGAHGRIYAVRRTINVNRQIWTLVYDGVHAIHAVCRVFPYLLIKREQAEAMLHFWFSGRAWANFGPRGTPAVVREIRLKWHKRLSKMK